MKARRIFQFFALALPFFYLSPGWAAFDAPSYYDKKCSSCHTVGGGDDIGPDLKGISTRRSNEWLFKMINSSQDLIKSGDPIATELFNKYRKKKMPDQDLSNEEMKQLIAFIEGGGPGEQAIDSKPATDATPAEIKQGEKLFLGLEPLAKGGPACIFCHQAGNIGPLGGGTLGPNLTDVYSRYKDKGLSKALAKMGFPIMLEIYATKPITEEEAFALKAFLYQTDQKGNLGMGFQKKFIFLGLGGGVLLLGVIDLSWRKRRKKSTKPSRGGVA